MKTDRSVMSQVTMRAAMSKEKFFLILPLQARQDQKLAGTSEAELLARLEELRRI
jgi:hypothetical protein